MQIEFAKINKKPSEIPEEDLVCHWCNEHKLVSERTQHGVYLRCESPAEFNCPDATGTFKSLEESVDCVNEMTE